MKNINNQVVTTKRRKGTNITDELLEVLRLEELKNEVKQILKD